MEGKPEEKHGKENKKENKKEKKEKQKEVKDDFSYCCKCNKFLCHSCILNHPNNLT